MMRLYPFSLLVLAIIVSVTFGNPPVTQPSQTTWTPETRKENRPPELWREYMRGVVDHFATPIPFETILSDEQKKTVRLVDDPIRTHFKTHTDKAIQLNKTETLSFAKPLPIDLKKYAGKHIRLFYWIKGNKVGASNNCWHAPTTLVTMRDAEGNSLGSRRGLLHTQGTYPWHCYYQDVFIPENAAGVYLIISTKFRGHSRWSAFSWEPITEENTYSLDEQQDPFTGSLAKNPVYDEMPYHLKYHGINATRYAWRFVLGKKIGLVGQPYDITTKAGFTKYFREQAGKDPIHMNHAILHMGQLYHSGKDNGQLPPMEEGWFEHFVKTLKEAQDPKTGYFNDGKGLSLGATFHIASMHYRYWRMPRFDRPDRRGPSTIKGYPYAKQIIETTLMMQSSWTDPAGVKRKAAWNYDAYRYTTTPDKSSSKCYLGSTWDAIHMMRTASRYVDDPDLKQAVYDSVKDAWWYVLHKNILPDGMYKKTDTDTGPTTQGYMDTLLGDTAALERKIRPDFPKPEGVSLTPGNEQNVWMVSWTKPKKEQTALRIYVAPRELPLENVNEAYLAGIIHQTGEKIYEMDPLLAAQKIRQAYAAHFGSSLELPPPNTWRGALYLPWKFRMIRWPIPSTINAVPLPVQLYQPNDKTVYVSAVNWYGEESPLVPLSLFER